ncbi:MAG: TIGR04283 family arsenosugar biosynthesis glycosyltransferase [Candidatus Rokubacteria bacterium]|nr:TIGR04283 family arsenosugar biosynthesis glycosyltransferase [Candidatus Rokubacteria bacterium]
MDTDLPAATPRPSVAIVIPVLNEAIELPALLRSLCEVADGAGVVFVDGGSVDGSVALIRDGGYRVLVTGTGRARQMNAGVAATSGDVLLFLHADARLSAGALTAIGAAMRDPRVVAGRFELVYRPSAWPYTWIARLGNLRARLTGIGTGDQTLFVRRTAFEAVGRYPDVPLMEDVELSRRLKRVGRIVALRIPVVASARKYRREGVWRTVALMWLLRALHALGVSPARLHRLYYDRDVSKRLP